MTCQFYQHAWIWWILFMLAIMSMMVAFIKFLVLKSHCLSKWFPYRKPFRQTVALQYQKFRGIKSKELGDKCLGLTGLWIFTPEWHEMEAQLAEKHLATLQSWDCTLCWQWYWAWSSAGLSDIAIIIENVNMLGAQSQGWGYPSFSAGYFWLKSNSG